MSFSVFRKKMPFDITHGSRRPLGQFQKNTWIRRLLRPNCGRIIVSGSESKSGMALVGKICAHKSSFENTLSNHILGVLPVLGPALNVACWWGNCPFTFSFEKHLPEIPLVWFSLGFAGCRPGGRICLFCWPVWEIDFSHGLGDLCLQFPVLFFQLS